LTSHHASLYHRNRFFTVEEVSAVRGRRWPTVLACLATTTALCAGCSAAVAPRDENAYVLGVIASQTGPGSQLGVGELRGAQLATDRLNATGGVNGRPLRLMTADDQSNPAQAVLAARRMIDHVDAIVGPSLSGPCRAVIPLATSAQVVNYCLSPGIKPAADGWQWSASAATQALAEQLLEYWKHRGITRIGLVFTTDASGVDGAESTRHAATTVGATVVGSASYSPDSVSVTSQLQSVIAGKPQALVVWSSGAAAGVAFKGVQQMGLHLPVATTNGNLTYSFLDRIADYLPETLLIPATQDFWWQHSPRGEDARKLEQDYHDSYVARFGEQPDFGPGVAFDAVSLIAKALYDPRGTRVALQNLREFVGVAGTYSFSPASHRGLTRDDVGIVRAGRDSFTYVGR
jgi:branched-chain amino acid transport system substrate-binding protein